MPADARWKTLDDFLAEARANPRKLKVSVSGLRSVVTTSLYSSSTSWPGSRIVTVPFTGGGGEATLAAASAARVDGTAGFAPGMKGRSMLASCGVWRFSRKANTICCRKLSRSAKRRGKDTFPVGYYVIAPNGLPKPVLEKLLAVSKVIVESEGSSGASSRPMATPGIPNSATT